MGWVDVLEREVTMPSELPLDCARIEADSILLLDGGLDVLRVEAVNAHFATCSSCAAFFRDLRRLLVDEAGGAGEVDFSGAGFTPTNFGALAARLEGADLRRLGRLLYEVLKAEFLYDYGDNVEPADEPIDDPLAERRRGAELVEELRDWEDGTEVEGVDLRAVARHFVRPPVDTDRLDALILGMRAVRSYDPPLAAKADYYIGLAHIKARRADEAVAALEPLRRGADAALARLAQITLAVIRGMLQGAPAASVAALRSCLVGDAFDGVVHFNLAQACFEAAGERVDAEVLEQVVSARRLAPGLVERQLSVSSARRFRHALMRAESN